MTKYFIAPLLGATLAVAANAQDASVPVDYADLDLTSESGVARLDNRIDAAIRTVCNDYPEQRALPTALAVRKCKREVRADVERPRQMAIARARGQIPSVELASARSHRFAVTARRR